MVEIYKDEMGSFRFRVRAKNNRIVCESAIGYETIKGCNKGIQSMAENIFSLNIKDVSEERKSKNV